LTDGIVVRHCPTERMLADFFTKPLEGNLFREFRDFILGYKHKNNITTRVSFSREEHVGNSDLVGVHGEETPLKKSFPPELYMGSWTVVKPRIKYISNGSTATHKNSTRQLKITSEYCIQIDII
jgi:hypothetical protein